MALWLRFWSLRQADQAGTEEHGRKSNSHIASPPRSKCYLDADSPSTKAFALVGKILFGSLLVKGAGPQRARRFKKEATTIVTVLCLAQYDAKEADGRRSIRLFLRRYE